MGPSSIPSAWSTPSRLLMSGTGIADTAGAGAATEETAADEGTAVERTADETAVVEGPADVTGVRCRDAAAGEAAIRRATRDIAPTAMTPRRSLFSARILRTSFHRTSENNASVADPVPGTGHRIHTPDASGKART